MAKMTCPSCNGTKYRTCHACGGSGEYRGDTCGSCGGSGEVYCDTCDSNGEIEA